MKPIIASFVSERGQRHSLSNPPPLNQRTGAVSVNNSNQIAPMVYVYKTRSTLFMGPVPMLLLYLRLFHTSQQ